MKPTYEYVISIRNVQTEKNFRMLSHSQSLYR
jgi:hypothetical protein